jgi:uncharacterized protein YdhG (YjbR/CyaY superfamily)
VNNEVDAYIAAAPKAAQPHLRELRRIIRDVAPRAEERISYRMPYYHLDGRLVYFAAHSKHVGLYALGETYKAEGMQRYVAAKGTLQFRFDEPLPAAQIRRLIEKRVRENAAKAGKPAGARRASSGRSEPRAGASASRRASRS